MKKIYQTPEADVITLNLRDIITSSYTEDDADDLNVIDVSKFDTWFS